MARSVALAGGTLVALVVAVTSCGGGDQWVRFTAQEAGFSALFPGQPVEDNRIENTDFGRIDFTQFLHVDDDGTEYIVMYANVSVLLDSFTPEEMLDAFAPRLVQKSSGELIYEFIVSLDGHPGREVKVRAADGAILKMRGYLAGERNYQVGVVTPPEKQFSSDMQKFLEAFEIRPASDVTGQGDSSQPSIATALLEQDDLPNGWTPFERQTEQGLFAEAVESGEVAYLRLDVLHRLEQIIQVFPPGETDRIMDELTSLQSAPCNEWTDPDAASFSVCPMDFPTFGDATVARRGVSEFPATGDLAATTVRTHLIYVQRGNIITSIWHIAEGEIDLDLAETEILVQKAARKLTSLE